MKQSAATLYLLGCGVLGLSDASTWSPPGSTSVFERSLTQKGVKRLVSHQRSLELSNGGAVHGNGFDRALHVVFSGLYKGPAPACATTALARNLKFLAAGAIAGVVSRTLVSPLEVVATINMATVGAVDGPMDVLIKLWALEGATGFYKGNGANCLKVAPTKGIQFVSFEFLKRQVLLWKRWCDIPEVLEPIERLVAGGFARTPVLERVV
jgi:hypothetical protein